MYDITRRDSFIHLSHWLEEAKQNSNPEMVIILVGNKKDLEHKREVSQQEAESFARENGLLFIETSAKTGQNVEEAFICGAAQVLEKVKKGLVQVDDDVSFQPLLLCYFNILFRCLTFISNR